jgi:hypothetical protein
VESYPNNSVDLSKATLRVMSKHLSQPLTPHEKSRISQCLQTIHDGGTLRSWSLRAPESPGADLDGQISLILDQLTSDLMVWQHLAENYRLDMFVGLFMESRNRGVEISPASMQALASRGILLGLDIYGPATVQEGPGPRGTTESSRW